MITWLVSYPRSGNTYLRILLNKLFDIKSYSIHGDYNDIAENPDVSEVVGHLEIDELNIDKLRDSDQEFYIKSHDLPDGDCFDFERDRFIYIVRDGREASLSYTHYLNNIAKENVTLSDIILGNVSFGSWGEHVRKWVLFSKSDNFLLLKFESFMDEFDESLRNINYFIHRNNADFNDEQKVPSFSELNSKYPDFFRSGKKSSWTSNYTQSQQEVFEILSRNELLAMGYVCNSHDSNPLVDYNIALYCQKLDVEVMKIKRLLTVQQGGFEQSLIELQARLQEQQKAYIELQQLNQTLQQEKNALSESIRFKLGSMLLLPLDMLRKLQISFKRDYK